MTLLERSAVLREQIKKVRDLEAKKNIAEGAGEKGRQVEELSGLLAYHRGRASLLGMRNDRALGWPTAKEATGALASYREALAASKDPSEPTAAKAFAGLIKSAQGIERGARALVEARLDEERTALGALDRSALGAWRVLATDPRPLDAALADLDRLLKLSKAQWLKLSCDDLARELAAKAAILAAIDRLMAVAVPPAVRAFLESARQGGAAPDLFTEEVRTWLAANKQLGRVRVVFK